MAVAGQTWQKDAADQNFDYMFKLLIIGNSSVGKTSFLFRYYISMDRFSFFYTKLMFVMFINYRNRLLKLKTNQK